MSFVKKCRNAIFPKFRMRKTSSSISIANDEFLVVVMTTNSKRKTFDDFEEENPNNDFVVEDNFCRKKSVENNFFSRNDEDTLSNFDEEEGTKISYKLVLIKLFLLFSVVNKN